MKTLNLLVQDYLAYCESRNFSRHTLYGRGYILRGFVRFLRSLGVKNPAQLLRQHLMAWQRHLAKRTTRKGLPLNPRTLNVRIKAANAMLKHLAEGGYIQPGLAKVLRYLKEPRVLPTGILPHDEVRRLLDSINTSEAIGYRDRAILELMYSSGLRAGEVVGLTVGSVDFKGGSVMVTGKGGKERVVPVGRTALSCLETYLKGVRPLASKAGQTEALFLNEAGGRLEYWSLLRMVHRRSLKVGLSRASCHWFRRSCTTELIRGGANLWHIKEMLGHESLDTLKHYARLNIADLKETHARCHPREKTQEKR